MAGVTWNLILKYYFPKPTFLCVIKILDPTQTQGLLSAVIFCVSSLQKYLNFCRLHGTELELSAVGPP